MMTSIIGTAATTDVCALSLSSTLPPTLTWYPFGRLAFSAAIFGASDWTTVAACMPGARSACTVTVGSRSLRQTIGIFLAVLDGGDLAQRNGFPVRQRHLKRPDRRQRRALLGGGRGPRRRRARSRCASGWP